MVVSVVDGVERDLEALPAELRESGVAAVALVLASRIDAGKGSPSECGKVVLDALTRLRELAPPVEEKGLVVDIRAKRARRLRSAQGGSAA